METKPGYKQTDVGVIPEEWELSKIGNLCTAVLDCHHSTPVWTTSGSVVIRNQNIRDGKLDLSQPSFTDELHFLERTRRAVPSFRDLVITREAPMGLVCMIPEGLKCCLGQRMVLLRPNHDAAESEYLLYALLSEAVQRSISVAGGTGSTVSNLRIPALKGLKISAPLLAEQRAIATALSDVDGLLDGLDRLIAKKRDLKQAAMQQLLTGQTRLPGFDGEWEVKTLGDIVEKIVGGGTPSRANNAFWGGEIPWVTVKDFATFSPHQSQESITRLGLCNSASHLIPAGTLITSTRMALGKAVVYEVDVSINQDLKALFLKSDTSVAFLTYWFEHFGCMIDELGSGSTVKGISLIELRRFPFQAPRHPEQTAIARLLSEMDAELAALEKRREKIRALKQAMMQELLTGKTRLV